MYSNFLLFQKFSETMSGKKGKIYKVYYFDMRGRAEIIRMVLSAADKEFEDIRLSREEWEKMKPSTPSKVLPIVDTPEGERLVQSMATARNLARRFGMMGKSDRENYLIDRAIDQGSDFVEGLVAPMFAAEADAKRVYQEFMTNSGNRILEGATTFLKEGKGRFFAGDRLTLADLWWSCILNQMQTYFPDALKGFPELTNVYDQVLATNKGVAQWEKKRPVTHF